MERDKLESLARKAGLAQPEPVGEVDEVAQRFDGSWSAIVCTGSVKLRAGDKLYTVQPARPWVDLTKDEVIAIRKSPRPVDLTAWSDTLAFARAISEALRKKNGGTE